MVWFFTIMGVLFVCYIAVLTGMVLGIEEVRRGR